jgi:hypothetical protein
LPRLAQVDDGSAAPRSPLLRAKAFEALEQCPLADSSLAAHEHEQRLTWTGWSLTLVPCKGSPPAAPTSTGVRYVAAKVVELFLATDERFARVHLGSVGHEAPREFKEVWTPESNAYANEDRGHQDGQTEREHPAEVRETDTHPPAATQPPVVC